MNTRITHIGQLLTPTPMRSVDSAESVLDIHSNTELLLQDDRIAKIGPCAQGETIDREIDARGGVVLPGLVDPHFHFSLGVDDAAGTGVEERLSVRLRRALTEGVTAVEVKCRSIEELSTVSALAQGEAAIPQLIPSLYGATATERPRHADRMSALIGDAIPTVRRRHLAAVCDIECGDGGYTLEEARTILRAARASGLYLKICANGERADVLSALAVELGLTAVCHPVRLGDGHAERLRQVGIVSVLLPGEELLAARPISCSSEPSDAIKAAALGTNAGARPRAIGSMWTALTLAVGALGMSLEQALAAVTLHGARAIEATDEIGTIQPKKRGDLVILDVSDYRDLLSGLGENPVRVVIRSGEVVVER